MDTQKSIRIDQPGRSRFIFIALLGCLKSIGRLEIAAIQTFVRLSRFSARRFANAHHTD
ncbi:hypothetical protein [uncultured Nostoc sp.]|uniref:hypothetical protein n=1 Tax=uncultured Nostoc sp. TaxID=340711 RepID=UPI0035CC848B